MSELTRKNYRNVNVAVLGLCLYCLTLPLFLPLITRFIPDLFVCASVRVFGAPCPLCGMTRAAAALFRGDVPLALSYNAMVIPVAVMGLLQVLYRATMVFVVPVDTVPVRLIRTDLWLHGILGGGYLVFGVCYVLGQVLGA